MPIGQPYAPAGALEEDPELFDVEMVGDMPLIHLGLTYGPAEDEALARPRYAAMPLWLVGTLALAWIVNRYYRD